MSKTSKFSGNVVAVRFAAKVNSFVLDCGKESVIVGSALIASMAAANGLSPQRYLRALPKSDLSCVIRSVEEGEAIVDKNGNPVMKGNVAQTYNKSHNRYEDVTITISDARLRDMDIADSIGEAIARNWSAPAATALPVSAASAFLNEEPLSEKVDEFAIPAGFGEDGGQVINLNEAEPKA